MSLAIPVVLLSRRRDVAEALARDPGAMRYALTEVDPAHGGSLAAFSAAIVDAPSLDDAAALVRRLRRTQGSLELLAVVADDRAGVEAIRNGVFDFVTWPPAEPAALWTALARLVERAGAPRGTAAPRSIGGYTVLERLGAGGMAVVYLAQKPGDDPLVLKVMRPEIAEEERYVAMFLEEARISQALSHPNLVRVYDAGGTQDELYLVMEHVPGRNLAEIGKNAGWRIPPPLACWIAAEVAAALEHAHSAVDASGARVALIHRDVNPPNVLVRDDGAVKLADFGIARTKHHHARTTQGVLRGKLEYMSPEQVDARTLDARSDLFSLGVVLYQMLTGQLPFTGMTTIQILQRVQQARCEPPSAHDPTIPPALDGIVMKALARHRDERYASAKAFEEALRAWIAGTGRAIGKADLAAFVRDVTGTRGVIPQQEERGGLTRSPGVVTALSPARPAPVPPHAEPTLTKLPAYAEPTLTKMPASAEPTLTRAPEPEVTVTTAAPAPVAPPASPSVTVSVPEVSKETAESPEDSTSFSVRREEVTVERRVPSAPAPAPLAREPAVWRSPAAIGAAATAILALLALAISQSDTRAVATPTPLAVVTTPSSTATATPLRAATPLTASISPTRTALPAPTPRVSVATPRSTPAPARKGTVSIWVTDGWAAVSVDGKSLGLNAPVIGLELPEGKHRVTLENAPLKVRRDYDVTIVADEETKLRVSIR